MERYYVWWHWLTNKRVVQVCQHQLSFLLFQTVDFYCSTFVISCSRRWQIQQFLLFSFCRNLDNLLLVRFQRSSAPHTNCKLTMSPATESVYILWTIASANHNQWCGLRPSVLGQDWSETKKICFGLGLGLAGLCCRVVKHSLVTLVVIMILKVTTTFQVLFIVSLFCAWNITTVEINSGVHILKSLIHQVPLFTSGGLGLVSSGLGLVTLMLVIRIWSCLHHWSQHMILLANDKYFQSHLKTFFVGWQNMANLWVHRSNFCRPTNITRLHSA